MNFIVFLNTQAGELEKILSGTKSMLLKDAGQANTGDQKVSPGDTLYFLRDKGDCDLRVKATVSHVMSFADHVGEDLSHALKEMQAKLQLTEDQFNNWSARGDVMCIEFGCAHKIEVIHVVTDKVRDQLADGSSWLAFEELSQITRLDTIRQVE